MEAILQEDKIEMRQVYANFLREIGEKDKRVVALEADLSSSMSTNKLKKELGDHLINVGIMEAEMIGCAAGLSVTGFKPFIHTFANFATRRVYDQVFVSLAYAKLNAVILGSDAGVTAESNGGTHMPFGDLSLMRIIPQANVYEASDATLLNYLLTKAYNDEGLSYIRTIRKKAVKIYSENEKFEEGAKLIRKGADVSIIASGIMVAESLEAADMLAKQGIEANVIDMYQIKPVNREVIKKAAETGAVVTAENHNIIGGLGSAVAEVLAEEKPTLMKRIGINEVFGQVGKTNYLKEIYGITSKDIADACQELVNKK